MSDQYGAETEQPPDSKLILDDADFLRIVRAERNDSIGMADAPHGGDEIVDAREKAYEYYKGEMRDMPAPLENRSKVVTSEVRDAILTTVPDIVEMFISGDEIGTFEAVGPEDEDLAKQETLVVNHVIFGENDAFVMVHDVCHDALLANFGVVHFYPEVDERQEEESFEGMLAVDLQAASQSGELVDVEEIVDPAYPGEPLYNFKVRRNKRDVRICIDPVAPEDFSVGRDTIKLRDATYACMRTRVRAQQLIADGFDPELVDTMPDDTHRFATDEIDQARDLAGEHEAEGIGGAAVRAMRTVVVHVHNVRVDADGDGKPEIWRVTTDENESVLLERKQVQCIEFAGGTPIRQPHRLYGFSQADLLIEVQKIKTSLTRMLLDMGYFALNTRHEINVERATDETIMDYLRNEPGVPVRTKGQAITPISPGAPGFNAFEALEYFSTLGELRAGVMRASMGIDPDSLHETKGAALAMLNAAQRRIRFIARTLAETCFRDLFLGVHTLLRQHGAEMRKRIRGEWVTADPTSWGSRRDMTVDIGSGSAGREYDLAVANNIRGMITEIVTGQAQGAIKSEIVTPQNVYNLARRTIERAGWKNTDLYVTDPAKRPPQQQGQEQPDPEQMKAQAEIQKMQADAQLDQQKAAIQAQHDQRKAESDAQLALTKMRADMQVAREKMAADMQLKREQMAAEMAIEEERMRLEAENATYQATLQAHVAQQKVDAMSKNRPGGRLDR